MGVLIEGLNVVLRNTTVEQRFPGGMRECEARCPNATFCTDGEVCRVGFMVWEDAVSYIAYLESLGFAGPTAEGSPEVALIDKSRGFVHPCDWLDLGQADLGGGKSAAVAWLRGKELSNMVAPPHREPGAMLQMDVRDLEKWDFLGTEEGVDVFRDKATGELRYAGRTQQGAPPAHISNREIQERFDSLSMELEHLGALENEPSGDYQGDLNSLHERARRLVEDTEGGEPGPLQLQGITARLLEDWDEAAALFRRVTELRPEYLDGWMELTWALASLRRFEEAERAARTAVGLGPENAAALGNLAAVLLQQGKVDEARPVAERAVQADPADAKAKTVLALVERAASRGRPWWKRLLKT